MTRNAQSIVLIVASQISWLVCCAASVPAFQGATYVDTPMQWLLMLNGLAIVGSGSLLIVLAILVKAQKEDALSQKKLSPFFSIGMGVTAFMLIAQVIFSVSHKHSQPDEASFTVPEPDAVHFFEFVAEMEDGREEIGAGFVMAHPVDQRPVFVTTVQPFSPDTEGEEWMGFEAIDRELTRATARHILSDEVIELGETISYREQKYFSWFMGSPSPEESILFFEAPGMARYVAPVKTLDGLNKTPDDQLMYGVLWELPLRFDTMRVEMTFDEWWELDGAKEKDVYVSTGTPILDFEHQVVGVSVDHYESGTVSVVPVGLLHDYLGGSPY